jgi:hypothetical protein
MPGRNTTAQLLHCTLGQACNHHVQRHKAKADQELQHAAAVGCLQIEAERKGTAKASPFGDAKPREAVLAVRTGKSEQEICKQEVGRCDAPLTGRCL